RRGRGALRARRRQAVCAMRQPRRRADVHPLRRGVVYILPRPQRACVRAPRSTAHTRRSRGGGGMTTLSIALAVVGLAALRTARDVVLRLHRGSEARAALEEARHARQLAEATQASTQATSDAAAARVDALATELREEWERVRSEHVVIKARLAMGGRRG